MAHEAFAWPWHGHGHGYDDGHQPYFDPAALANAQGNSHLRCSGALWSMRVESVALSTQRMQRYATGVDTGGRARRKGRGDLGARDQKERIERGGKRG